MKDLGLLFMRLCVGLSIVSLHGWVKFVNFGPMSERFFDPIGLGSPVALGLALFAELFCGLAVTFGLFTRAAAIPLLITMGTVVFVLNAGNPWQKSELAAIYGAVFLTLIFTGAGRFSLDHLFKIERRFFPRLG